MARRLLLLVALLMGLTALAAAIAPRESSVTDRPSAERSRPLAEPRLAGPAHRSSVVAHRLSTDEKPERQSVVAEVGDTVRLTVVGDVTDTAQLQGLDEIEGVDLDEPIDPNTPAVFELIADAPADYAITLLEADRLVGTLHVKSDR